MIDLETVVEFGKHAILPTALVLVLVGGPLGYQFLKLQKERSALTATRTAMEKKNAGFQAELADRQATLDAKSKELDSKEAELNAKQNQIDQETASLKQRQQEYEAALIKLRRDQAAARLKPKPAKGAAASKPRVSPKKAAVVHKPPAPAVEPVKPISLKATPPAEAPLPASSKPAQLHTRECITGAERTKMRLKRKIAATRFAVNYRPADLIPNIRLGLPEDLLRRLEASGEFLPRNGSRGISASPLKVQADAISNMNAVREVAHRTGSQIVLSGVIDAGPGRTDYGRWIEIEVDAYDGMTGVQIAKRRHGMAIGGEGEIETGSLFGSTRYFSTPFGKRMDALMDTLTMDIADDLSCKPFMAKVTAIDNQTVTLDSGAVSGIVPGDKFTAYHGKKQPLPEPAAPRRLRLQAVPVGSVTIRQVFPLFSIGELSANAVKGELQVGDFASSE